MGPDLADVLHPLFADGWWYLIFPENDCGVAPTGTTPTSTTARETVDWPALRDCR